MDTHRIKRRRRRRSKASFPTVFLPDELIAEVLSFLNVKTIVQLKCLSKSWNALISDPTFIEKHLKKSSQKPHLTLFWNQRIKGFNLVPFPVHRLLKNPSITVYSDNFHRLKSKNNCIVVGSCNGLLCLHFHSLTRTPTAVHLKEWLRFWNPATRTRSKKLGTLCYSTASGEDMSIILSYFKFTFGYDASTRTYKVVTIRRQKNEASWKNVVNVFSLGNNCWRNIESFIVISSIRLDIQYRRRLCALSVGVHLSGTVNWLAVYKLITHVEQFMIVALDLSTEKYKRFQLPSGFNEVPFLQPVLRVLMDCLCFSYDSNKTEFVLWHMKEYGVEESWTQLFKISYQNLPMLKTDPGFQLACLYVDGDMVIFANKFCNRAFIYNLKDRTVERIKIRNSIHWFTQAKHYVESLVSVR